MKERTIGRGRDATRERQSPADQGLAWGFTLIELAIVIAIIGILVAFVLAAGAEGVRNAEIRATQSLIMKKLDVGLTDRLEVSCATSPSRRDRAGPSSTSRRVPNPNFIRCRLTQPQLLAISLRRSKVAQP